MGLGVTKMASKVVKSKEKEKKLRDESDGVAKGEEERKKIKIGRVLGAMVGQG